VTWKALAAVDRRVIFVILIAGILLPMVFPLKMPIAVTPEVQSVYDRIEALKAGDTVMMTMEYDPSTLAEMQPMSFNMLRHLFRRGVKVVAVCLFNTGTSQVEQDLKKIADEAGKKYGEDYVFLGYKPYPAIVITALGQDFRNPFPSDYYGTRLDEIPVMKGIKNFSSVKLVLSVNATSGVDFWLQYGQSRYRFPLAMGMTAVMASDYYTYVQSGQLVGLIGGLKGAAEYETLMHDDNGNATRIMNIQSVVHCIVVAFIVIGNVAFLMSGGKFRMGGRA
jgi:hypothetical protein